MRSPCSLSAGVSLPIVAGQRAVHASYCIVTLFICMSLCPPSNSFVFYMARAVSKENMRLYPFRTCLGKKFSTIYGTRRCVSILSQMNPIHPQFIQMGPLFSTDMTVRADRSLCFTLVSFLAYFSTCSSET
jgi:hypothetical protein